MNEKISVIMSVYKEPITWIKQSVDSVLAQTYTNFEFIIICDNPEYKEAIAVLQEYKDNDNRIIFYVNEKNLGLTKSLNVGLSFARGGYIARMDADDVCVCDRFEKQVGLLSKRLDVDICSTAVDEINEKGEFIRNRTYPIEPLEEFYVKNPIAHPTVMFRNSLVYTRNPLYNEDFRSSQDYELWGSFIKAGYKFYVLQSVLLHYRISTKQVSNTMIGNQYSNHQIVRKSLIDDYLVGKGILDCSQVGNAMYMVHQINRSIGSQDNDSKKILYYILFSLYYTLSTQSPCNITKALFDESLFLFHLPIKMVGQILLSFIHKSRFLGY